MPGARHGEGAKVPPGSLKGLSALTGCRRPGHPRGVQVLRVQGSDSVAALLRALADEVEVGLAEVNGHAVGLAPSLHATVEIPDDPQLDATVIDVRLVHPTRRAWNLTGLRAALARPGD
jgi:hypothetical protein